MDKPEIAPVGVPSATPLAARTSSSQPHSSYAIVRGSSVGERAGDLVVIGERNCRVADDLAGLVAFSSDENHITFAQHGNSGPDRFGPVANLAGDAPRDGGSGEDLGADGSWDLGARVIIRDNGDIGLLDRDATHNGALTAITVATAAENADEAGGDEGAAGVEGGGQGFRLVSVVDDG